MNRHSDFARGFALCYSLAILIAGLYIANSLGIDIPLQFAQIIASLPF